jgi:HD-GYP domain-containing protein (c-di-GMP phosphodiesterase class II)
MDIDSYDSPDAEALLSAGDDRVARSRRDRRELATNCVGAVAFLVAASALAIASPWHTPFSVWVALLVIASWIAVQHVKFPVAAGFTYPTLLIFIPALFILPTPIVPLIAAAAYLLRWTPALIRGRVRVSIVPGLIADAWYTIGPTLVIVLAGAQQFGWDHWPIYVAAFAVQLLIDQLTVVRLSIADGISPRAQLRPLLWSYAVDFTLAPLGLLIASAAVDRPGLLLIAFSPVALLSLISHERQRRLDAILELSTAYRGTTLLLGDIIEADDSYTGVHSRDVVDLSLGVADALGLDATQRRRVEFGALLHDVGKIRIPKEILNKNGPLNAAEWECVRRHTIDGEQMLRQVGGKLADIASIVRSSHERWDGGGYPDRLATEDIPIESRIIAACDAYNAMTTDRPYRSAMHPGEALDELRRGAGSQFDPQVVAALDRRIEAEMRAQASDSETGPEKGIGAENEPRNPAYPGYTAVSARL